MSDPKPQPAAADVGAPSDVAGDDLGHRVTGPTEDDRREHRARDAETDRISEHSDAGTTGGGGAGGPEPPPV